MTTVWIAFALALAVAVLCTRAVMAMAWRFGILDQPDGDRKIHTRPIPRIGGIAIYMAFCVPLILLIVFRDLSTMSEVLTERLLQIGLLLGGAFFALLLGLMDDVFKLSAFWKLIWQIVIASVMYMLGFGVDVITNPFGAAFHLGALSYPITVFWYVGCMNAVNLVDGLDGLAAGTTLFVCITLFLVSMEFNNLLGMLLMASLGGALLGFLVFNFPPARIFLGDSGSMLLGFLVATLSLVGTSRKAETAMALFVPVVALGLPIFDTMMAILRRWYKRLPISTPDREHIHHMLLALGWSHRRAVVTLYITCLGLGAVALLITVSRSEVVLVIVGSLIIAFLVSVRVFSGVRFVDVMSKLAEDEIRRETTGRVRRLVNSVLERIQTAHSFPEIWGHAVEVFPSLGMDSVTLTAHAGIQGMDASSVHWQNSADTTVGSEGGGDCTICRMVIRHEAKELGILEIVRRDGDQFLFRDAHEMMDLIRKAMAARMVELEKMSGHG